MSAVAARGAGAGLACFEEDDGRGVGGCAVEGEDVVGAGDAGEAGADDGDVAGGGEGGGGVVGVCPVGVGAPVGLCGVGDGEEVWVGRVCVALHHLFCVLNVSSILFFSFFFFWG